MLGKSKTSNVDAKLKKSKSVQESTASVASKVTMSTVTEDPEIVFSTRSLPCSQEKLKEEVEKRPEQKVEESSDDSDEFASASEGEDKTER